jgi:ABC-three component (ABC-3C) system Middle Component 3
MSQWTERPRLEATMLNPALLAVLLAAAAQDYEKAKERMPWPLGFLVLPLVLHRPTRSALPRNTRTHLSTWIGRNPLLRAGFPARAATMVPLTRGGIRFGLRAGVLDIDGQTLGGDVTSDRAAGELGQLMRTAALTGRWLATVDQPSTAFALLGVAP